MTTPVAKPTNTPDNPLLASVQRPRSALEAEIIGQQALVELGPLFSGEAGVTVAIEGQHLAYIGQALDEARHQSGLP